MSDGDCTPGLEPRSVAASWSVCCLYSQPAKTAEPIEMPFGLWTRVGPRNHVLNGVQIATREGAILRGESGRPGHTQRCPAVSILSDSMRMPIGVYKMGVTLALCRYVSNTIEPSMCGGDIALRRMYAWQYFTARSAARYYAAIMFLFPPFSIVAVH